MGRRAAQQARDGRQAVRRGTVRALCGADQRVAYMPVRATRDGVGCAACGGTAPVIDAAS